MSTIGFHSFKPTAFIRQLFMTGVLVGLLVILFQCYADQIAGTFCRGDFERFWATGRLFLAGSNPFSTFEIDQLFITNGVQPFDVKLAVRYPPWFLPLFALMGIFDLNQSRLAWCLVQVGMLLVGTEIIWRIYKAPPRWRFAAWVLAIIFAPTIFVITWEHISPVMLIGLIGFLLCLSAHRPSFRTDLWAGGFLILTTLKPHVVYLFYIFLLVWVINYRRWAVLLGLVGGCLGLLGLVSLHNPLVILQYLTATQSVSQLAWETPTLGFLLRHYFGFKYQWLQFAPMALGLIWFAYYWRLRREHWDWERELPLVLLVSVSTTAFVWTYDMVVLLFAPVVSFASLIKSHNQTKLLLGCGLYLGLNLSNLFLHRYYGDGWFYWFAPALLVGYWLARPSDQQGAVQNSAGSCTP
jgi:Glycosyltransferase family 87